MVIVRRSSILWKVAPPALKEIKPIRKEIGETNYNQNRIEFQILMTNYFSTGICQNKSMGISPLGFEIEAGWKPMKVRVGYFGSGKSGGLRLAVAVNCKEQKVNIVNAWRRKNDPSTKQFKESFQQPLE
jgi:hypothetical protein